MHAFHGASLSSSVLPNLDGTNLHYIAPYYPSHPYYVHDMEVDAAHSQLFYSDAVSYNGIRKANLDGSSIQNVLNFGGGDSQSTGLALDVADGQLFYVQYHNGTIGKINLDGSGNTTLLSGIQAFDIELDAINHKLYWTTSTRIQRANWDGSGIEDVLALPVPGTWNAQSLTITSAPEPSSLMLCGIGAAIVAAYAVRRRVSK